MAGVISAMAPAAVIDHAAHDIPQGDIRRAALALTRYWRLYPPGTVHLVVVDPGVGTDRRAVAARIDDRLFVAPDNGVLGWVLRDARRVRAVSLPVPTDPAAATFHGRDVFAPAAGRLARGDDLDALGPPANGLVGLDWPEPVDDGAGVDGVVVEVDRFGNLITNIPADRLPPGAEVQVWSGAGERLVAGPVRRTYGDVASGVVVALVGSLGLLEVSVRDGSAAAWLGAGRGARVRASAL